MNENNKTKSAQKKLLAGLGITVLGLLFVAVMAIFGIWHNEIGTVASMKMIKTRDDSHLDDAVYTIDVKGDFYLDEFVEQGGVKNDTELINFVTEKITRGFIDINISNPDIGCASFTAKTEDGDVLLGRNYDFSKTNTCIVTTEANEGRHATISTVDLQFLGMDVDNDGSSRKLVVTYNDSDSNIGEMEAKADYQWVTNFIIQPNYYSEDKKRPGHDRYVQMYEDLSKTNGVVADEAAAMNILATIGRRTWNNDDKNGCTVHSAIYNLTDKTVLWVPNEHFDDMESVFTFSFEK